MICDSDPKVQPQYSCHNAKVVHGIRTRGSSKIPGYESKLRATPSSIAHAAPSDVSLPAVSSFGGLRTPAPVYVASSSWAGIRKPSQQATSFDHLVGAGDEGSRKIEA